MRTFSAKPAEVQRDWYVIDATGKPVGRLASEIAHRLRGKHKATFTPHVDTGDYIVVINAEQARFTGRKEDEKRYYRHTGYPGGLRSNTPAEVRASHPERILERAVRGMLPKNRLGRSMLSKLKVYAGSEHRHHAQQPQPLEV